MADYEYRNVGGKEACGILRERGGSPDFGILDVRTPGEFRAARIPGAVNADIVSRNFEQQLDSLDRKKAYLVYCRTGSRSLHALPTLYRLGFEKIYHLEFGILDYAKEKCPLERG